MTKKTKKKSNGSGHKPKRKKVLTARAKVLAEARKVGVISNDRAREVGKWNQSWYHLNAMAEAGLLAHAGYNLWTPVKGKGRPRMVK